MEEKMFHYLYHKCIENTVRYIPFVKEVIPKLLLKSQPLPNRICYNLVPHSWLLDKLTDPNRSTCSYTHNLVETEEMWSSEVKEAMMDYVQSEILSEEYYK